MVPGVVPRDSFSSQSSTLRLGSVSTEADFSRVSKDVDWEELELEELDSTTITDGESAFNRTPHSARGSPEDLSQPHRPRHNRGSRAATPPTNGSNEADERVDLSRPANAVRAGNASRHAEEPGSPRRFSGLDGLLVSASGSWGLIQHDAHGRSLALPSNKVLYALVLLHYCFILGYSIASIFLQVWANSTPSVPNEAQDTLVKMQKLFGELAHKDAVLAHEDSTRLLAALSNKTAEEAKWETKLEYLHEIIKACIGYVVGLLVFSCDREARADNIAESKFNRDRLRECSGRSEHEFNTGTCTYYSAL